MNNPTLNVYRVLAYDTPVPALAFETADLDMAYDVRDAINGRDIACRIDIQPLELEELGDASDIMVPFDDDTYYGSNIWDDYTWM